jgi:hypothetical protein
MSIKKAISYLPVDKLHGWLADVVATIGGTVGI